MTTAELQRQRTAALAKGNEIRLAKAATKRAIKKMSRREGLDHVAELIIDCPPHVAKMRVGDLLCWVRYVTPLKLPDYLPANPNEHWRVRPTQTLQSIPLQQRDLIAERIQRMAASK